VRGRADVSGHQPAERILALAAYAREREGTLLTLQDIVEEVPGYEVAGPLEIGSAAWETVRKRLTRDIDDLQEHWGIVLRYDEGEHSYALVPPFFDGDERRALIAAAATVDVDGVGTELPGALGTAVDDAGAQIVLRVHEYVRRLRDAIGTRTAVEFVHDGRVRHVEPYAIGQWHNHWYVAGNDVDRGAVRRFRLDRIERVPETDPIALMGAQGTYEIPPSFDASTAFDLDPNVWGTDPLVRARVRVTRDHVDALRHELGGIVVERDGDAAVVELDVRHYISFRNRLLMFRGTAVVLAPDVLVDVVRDHLLSLAAAR
jgi:predicted DNA-binding transcriptional regulator YafY